MQTNQINFGIFMSLILPGFVAVLGMSYHSTVLGGWVTSGGQATPSVGGFLFLTVSSVFAGLTCSTIRWLAIDAIHACTGIRQPFWNFSKLGERQEAFNVLLNIHYYYYQFYANSIIALLWFGPARWSSVGFRLTEGLGLVCLISLFFLGSRDTLRKYYRRVEALLVD